MLADIIFLNPWILSGLVALPVLWWLLRITPPAPQRIELPTTRFLAGLIPDKQTPSHTPWWILLLRLLIAALVIIALSHPVYKPAQTLQGNNAMRLVIDNGWASAQTWDSQKQVALDLLKEAGRNKTDIYILPLAPAAGEKKIVVQGPISASQAEGIIKGMQPQAWPSDNTAAMAAIEDNKIKMQSYWLSHGLNEGAFDMLAEKLKAQGSLTVLTPLPEHLPLVITPSDDNSGNTPRINVIGPDNIPAGRPASIQALDKNGQIVDQQHISLKPGTPVTATFDAPETLQGSITQFRVSGAHGAGGIYLVDGRYSKKSIGLVGPADNVKAKPFVEARYYIKRAVEPFATLHEGAVEEVLKQSPSVIILPDVATMAPETLEKLDKWVRDGGTLLRFAGPNMAEEQGEPFLTPTRLHGGGGRALDGSLSWEKPQKMMPFSSESPLSGISLHGNIEVKRQMLAEPSDNLEAMTWAKLQDGTPLITGKTLDKGLLVMVHTAIDSTWSDLQLSGVFVDILKRITDISGHTKTVNAKNNATMEPQQVMDGLGALKKPDSTVQSIQADQFEATSIDSSHPPGFYGHEGVETALNIGDRIDSLDGLPTLPSGVISATYGKSHETNLMPYILYAALMLLLADWLLMLMLSGGFKPLMRYAACFMIFFATMPAHAAVSSSDMKYADGLYLAYIKTGDNSLDSFSQKGLENLKLVLNNRTSVEAEGVVGLNPERDTLIFFPFIYWPISNAQEPLSEEAFINLQDYLDHGGTILFDTRDGTGKSDALRKLTSRLSVPALQPIPKDHVLLRSFYLLSQYPGRITNGALWAETQSVTGRDNVSSIIIGSNDWAGAWADSLTANTFTGTTRQHEMSLRFGVNVMMYALTGNYKADQIHVKSILERLGE